MVKKCFFDKDTIDILKLALALKIAFLLFIYFFHTLIPFNQVGPQANYYYRPSSFKLGELLSAWDGQWYLNISEQGYKKNPTEFIDLAKYVDYPLFPLAIKHLSLNSTFDPSIVAIFLNFIFTVSSVLFLYKVTLNYFPQITARKTTMLFLFSPTAIFFTAIYTESLFFLLTLITIYLAQRSKWYYAGIFGFLAGLTRSLGLLSLILLIPLAITQFKKHRFAIIITFCLIPLSYLTFAKYSTLMTGIPNTYSMAQKYFGRSSPSLWNIIQYTYNTALDFSKFPLHGIFHSQLEVIVIFSILVLSLIYAKKLTWPLTLYNLSLIFLTLSSGTSTAIIRYLSASFPIYILLALVAKNHLTYTTLKYAFILFQSLFALLYVNWYWVA